MSRLSITHIVRLLFATLLVTSVYAQTPVTFQYVYDEIGQLVRVIDSAGNIVTYTYDEVGNILVINRTTLAGLPAPTLISANPSQINQNDPATVILTGTSLLGGVVATTHPGITVESFSGNDTGVTVNLTVDVTAPLGPAPLTITTVKGAATIALTVLAQRPRISMVTPSQGPSTGATPVRVAGLHFTPGTTIAIGGAPATGVVFVNASTLTATTPAGPNGQPPVPVDVVVTNSNGADILPAGFTYISAIRPGDLVSGTISAAGETDTFAFNGRIGDVVVLTLAETVSFGGAFGENDARATLVAPSGVQLDMFDSTVQRQFTLAEDGVYVITVNANNMVSTGSYNLGLERLSPLGPIDGTLTPGSLLSGTITAGGEVDLITLNGQTSDVIVLTLAETVSFGGPFGENDAQATLFAPSGTQLGVFESTVQQRFTLPESGTYLIKVNANTLLNTGSYNLGLERLAPLGPIDGTLTPGSLLSGTITAGGEVDLITLNGQMNDVIVLTLAETVSFGGPFGENDAQATLFAPSGAQLAVFESTVQQQFTLPATGTYLIKVNANTLANPGSYNLGLERLRPLGPIDGMLSCGSSVARSITQQGEVQLFTFGAATNAQVTIRIVETVSFGGPFGENDARATLFAPSGAQFAFLDSDSQQQFTLGESGTYIIQVNANTFLHTGSYDLSLVCP